MSKSLDACRRAPTVGSEGTSTSIFIPGNADFHWSMPRMMFVLVPVCAAIVAAFYRRPFSQHLVFALYLHAAIFLVLCLPRLANLTKSTILMAVFEGAALLFVVVYSQFSFRKVYGDSWPRVLLKSAGIAILYVAVGIVGVVATFTWAALT